MTLVPGVVLLRVLRRPWPWVLRYLLTAAPSAALSVLIALPLGHLFRLPLFAEALDDRSLDGLIEVVMYRSDGESPGPWLVLALLLVPVGWAIVRLVGVWLEGGILTTYALPDAPSRKTFTGASTRWFGRFLLLAFLGLGIIAILIGGTVGLALLGRALWLPLGSAIPVIGLAVSFGVGGWIRLARAVMTVSEDGHVVRALREAGRVMVHHPLPWLGVVVGALALRALLIWLGSTLSAGIPLRAWLLSLVIQQPVQFALVGVGLARRAAEVRLVQVATPSAQGPSEGPWALIIVPKQAMPDV